MAARNALTTPGRRDGRPGIATHQKLLTRLTDPRWYWLLVPTALVAFVLGVWGFFSYAEGTRSLSDAIYGSIQLFFLHAAPHPESHVGIALNIARFLAPTVAGWAALIALAALFRDRVQQMLIPFKRGHVVVCGLGYVGFAFLTQLHRAGYRVVVVEADDTNPQIKTCRGWGFPVVIGDAQLKPTLEAAGVKRAARLLAATPDSVVNTEIVTRARQLTEAGPAGRRLRCLARIDDPGLCVVLRTTESNRGDDSALDFFNTDEIGARLLLDKYPIDTTGHPHILVAHLDTLGAGLVTHAGRRWHDERPDPGVPLLVTVVDEDAAKQVHDLLAAYPPLEQVCEFTCYPATVRDLDRLAALDRQRRAGLAAGPPISRAYVTAYRDERTVQTALNVRQVLGPTVPVVAALSRAYAVGDLLEDTATPTGVSLAVFRTLEETCSTELVEGGSFEAVAHEIHRRYRQMQPADAPAPPWHELDDARKRSSRAQARHIGVKLRSIGCEITPLHDWQAKDFTFTDAELGTLSIMEHDRWQREKEADGWTLGPRDDRLKTDPSLVPWHELPTEIADWDTRFVKAIPAMLAAVGLQIVDVHHTAPRYPAVDPISQPG